MGISYQCALPRECEEFATQMVRTQMVIVTSARSLWDLYTQHLIPGNNKYIYRDPEHGWTSPRIPYSLVTL